MAKLNVQGLARRDKGLMSCIIPDGPDQLFGSADLSAGEPSITAHYSRDTNYFAANFGMVGKAPYYDERTGILYISDMYLMGASVAPTGRDRMLEAWNTTWNGNTFAEQWLIDADVVKNSLTDIRNFHKTAILALQYGQKPRGMVINAYDNGYNLNFKDAKGFYYAYWHKLFPGVRKLGEVLEARFLRDGYLVNEFGYRLVPDQPRKCLNYFIQSSVSGLMHVLRIKFFSACPYVEYITTIHDEEVFALPADKVEETKAGFFRAVESLNNDLQWSIDIRCGFVVGRSMYEAK